MRWTPRANGGEWHPPEKVWAGREFIRPIGEKLYGKEHEAEHG